MINKKKLRDHEPHQDLTMEEIFAHSSNIGMSKIVNDLSDKDFYKYCKMFGFGTKTGISLNNEAKGNLRNLNNWSQTSKTYISIGKPLLPGDNCRTKKVISLLIFELFFK